MADQPATSVSARVLAQTIWNQIPEDLRPTAWEWTLEQSPRWPVDLPRLRKDAPASWSPRYLWLHGSLRDAEVRLRVCDADQFDPERLRVRAQRATEQSGLHGSALLGLQASILDLIRENCGTDASDAFAQYIGCRATDDRAVTAYAYSSFLDTLPSTPAVLVERVQAAIDSADPLWAEDRLQSILSHQDCPLWLRAAAAFGIAVGDVYVHVGAADPASILMSCRSPYEAVQQLLWALPDWALALPGMTDDDEIWDFFVQGLGPTAEYHEPLWNLDMPQAPGDVSAMERPAFITAAAATAWILIHEETNSEALGTLAVSLRLLLDSFVRAGQLRQSAAASAILLDTVRAVEVMRQQELLYAMEWDDAELDSPLEGYLATRLLEQRGITTVGAALPDQFQWAMRLVERIALLHGALASLAVGRAQLRQTQWRAPLDALVDAIPLDDLIGGEDSSASIVHKLSGFEERLAEIGARLVGSPDNTGAVREAGRSSLISALPEIDNLWGDIDDLLFAFGRPRSDPAASVASDRARTVERLLHLTFPSLGTEEHFARLADQLAKNVRLKDVRVIRAEEMSEWIDVLRAAASSRNRVTHYHSRIAATDDDYAFWLPERFPEHRKDTVVRLMILLAEAQNRRRRGIGS